MTSNIQPRLRQYSSALAIYARRIPSQIELNRPMKGVSFRRVNHAELKLPPWAKVWWRGAHLLAQSGYFSSWVKAVPKFQIWYLYPGVSNLVPRVPGGVVRAGASAEAAQSTPLWATLSPGPKKAPCWCCCRAWGALKHQNMPKCYHDRGHVYMCMYAHVTGV